MKNFTVTAAPLDSSTSAGLRPGLTPYYFYDYFERDVRRLPYLPATKSRGKKGKPITQINHQFERNNVFDSNTNRGVGIRMLGYLQFKEAGDYTLQFLSNDGIELFLNEELIISDPKQHSDQLSPKAVLTISQPGWYPMRLEYFQRKGTAALKFFWKIPGSAEFVPVPPDSLGH